MASATQFTLAYEVLAQSSPANGMNPVKQPLKSQRGI